MSLAVPIFFKIDDYIRENKSMLQYTNTDLKLPSAMAMATNMLAMEDSVYIIELKPDGSFDRTVKLCEIAPDMATRIAALQAAKHQGWPIKIEHMETYNAQVYDACQRLSELVDAPINAHLFIGGEGKGSFGWHEDDGHVFCYMIEGEKKMETGDDRTHYLAPGRWLFMPKGLRHCATNISDTVMMSFGSYEFWGDTPHILE